MRSLRAWLAYRALMVWPISQDMPRWLYRIELWFLPWAGEWAYREPVR